MSSEQQRRVKAVFDDWAASGRGERMGAAHEPNARQGFERLALRPGERFLEVGCGVGYAVRWAAAVDPTVDALGVDLSPTMIERARGASTGLPNARFLCAPFPGPWLDEEAPFDAVFSMEVLYYFDDPDAALARIAGALSPGGRFVCVIDYYEGNPGSLGWDDALGVHMHRRTPEQWAGALRSAGLDDTAHARLREPVTPGEPFTWKHEHGSLLLEGRRSR